MAVSLGLTAASPVVALDRRGTLLWYLSDTSRSLEGERSFDAPDQAGSSNAIEAASKVFEHALTRAGLDHAADKPAWEGGPSPVRVVDAIQRAIQAGRVDGAAALVTFVVHADEWQRWSPAVAPLLTGSYGRGFERLLEMIKSGRVVVLGVQVLVSVFVTFGRERLFSGVGTLAPALAGVLIGFIGALLPLLPKYRKFVFRAVRAAVAGTDGAVQSTLARALAESQSLVVDSLVNLCGAEPGTLAKLIRGAAGLEGSLAAHDSEQLAMVALVRGAPTSAIVVQEVLPLLQAIDIPAAVRCALFEWVCRMPIFNEVQSLPVAPRVEYR